MYQKVRVEGKVVSLAVMIAYGINPAGCREMAEDCENERSYIREDKVLGSLDRLHEPTAQAAN